MKSKKTDFTDTMTKIMQRHGMYDCYDLSRDISHKKTGNLWIECFIKSDEKWYDSGINIDNGYFLYVVGDLDQDYYILPKKHLNTIKNKHELRTTKDGLHKGFLLSIKEAKHLSIVSFDQQINTFGTL